MELTDIKGIGPARSESMQEAGYGSVKSVAEVDDHEDFAEAIDVPADTALEFIVQAENMVEEAAAEVESSEPGTISEQIDEATEEQDSDEEDESQEVEVAEEEEEPAIAAKEDEGPPDEIDFSIEFETDLEFDVFFDATMEEKMSIIRANRTGVEEYEHVLEQMRYGSPEQAVDFTLTPSELNNLHNTVRQKSIDYKGKNLIDHMDAMKRILTRIDEVRSEHLF